MKKSEVKLKIDLFNTRIKELYKNITDWITSIGLETRIEVITITEQLSGEYETLQLLIVDDSEEIVARMKPIGIWVIGAEGRADLVGSTGSETIVYFNEGDPANTAPNSIGNRVMETQEKRQYGSKEKGWYWIDYRVVGRKPKLDQEIFLKLLEVVN